MYVSIASYRDPFLQSTVDDAFSKAAYPEELEIGCFIQAFSEDTDCLITNDYGGRVKYSVETPGKVFSVTTCRNRANQWLVPEHEFVLQIDSHSRFTNYWDDCLIADYCENVGSTNALFSSYLPGWVPLPGGSEKKNSNYVTNYSIAVFDEEFSKKSFFTSYELVPKLVTFTRSVGDYVPSWYLAGHFIFAPTDYFLSTTQPEWVLFWGEEVYHSLSAFTRGWDVYIPPNIPVYHMYPQHVSHLNLNKLWKDFPQEWADRHRHSTDLVIDAIVNRTIGEQFLGESRDLDTLYNRLGYDLGETFSRWRDEYNSTLH